MFDNSVKWPNGARCAVMLTFDFDAETLWTSRDPNNVNRPGVLSQGRYGAKVGVPKILGTLREEGIKSTFFVPGWTAENHTDRVEMILKDGHEVGHHGFHHLMPDPGAPHIVEEMDKGLDSLKRKLGVVPVGYRAPLGESCEELRVLLKKHGFLYSSSWRDDVRPYRQLLADGTPGVIELPATMTFDDWMYGLTHRYSPRPLFPREHVLSIWKDELAETRDWGGLITTVLHPQVSGRPMRLRLLREFLEHVKDYGDVWIGTGREIAGHFANCEAAAARAA